MTDRLSRILERQQVETFTVDEPATPSFPAEQVIGARILGIDTTTRAIMALVDAAVQAERARCAEIVQLARFGEIDGDFRSLIHRIENPDPEPRP